MLRTEMKTTTMIDRYKEENTETESQPEVDNEVHPLHWATSLGPSPMGTDPNTFLKWYKWFWTLQISFSSMDKSLQDLFSGLIQIGFQKQRKAK